MDKLPEAPASVTYSVTSPAGFPILFTVRDMTGTDLINKMTIIEKTLIEKGYKPQEKKVWGSKPPTPKEYGISPCPKCGSKTVLKTSKAGKKFEVCETTKYDPTTKTNSGCTHFKWLEVDTQNL